MLKILAEIADKVAEAIKLIPDSKQRGEELCMGADGTPTSQIDKIAENTILEFIELRKLKLNVLSEEIGFVDNGAKETLVLDPIDGTKNSVMGVPLYTVSMAVGRDSLSNVHTAFVRNLVTGDTYTAEKGKGAFKNGKRMAAKKRSDPDDLRMMIYMGNGAHPDAFTLAKRVRTSRAYGCASMEMILVAEGVADGFLMNSENPKRSIRVFDIAGSYLILKEAGGEVFSLDGRPFDMKFNLKDRSNFLAVGDSNVFNIVMNASCTAQRNVKYGVYVNMTVPSAIEYAKRVINALDGECVVLENEIAKALGQKGQRVNKMDVDVMVAIGGDGTILRALENSDAMIIGVNAGSLGFLTEIDPKDIEEGIAKLRQGDYMVEKRAKLRAVYNDTVLGDVVNEAVIHTDSIAKIRGFKVYVDGQLATDMRADGIMLSTPTGSTCYAMSLGAPIIDPRVKAIALVPMAAFKFTAKPMIIPTTAKITVELTMEKGCVLVMDGQKEYKIPGNSKIEFMMSQNSARFIKLGSGFYTRIREKLVNMS
jgi:Predicted sugar kinase